MAGKFRGNVQRLSKPKVSAAAKKSKAKLSVSLVKRSRKMTDESLTSRIAQLTAASSAAAGSSSGAEVVKLTKKTTSSSPSVMSVKPKGRAAMEVVSSSGKKTKERVERVVPTTPAEVTRTTAEAVGLKLLHRAIKTQSHKRLLPFQQRYDYERGLRQVATLGVVQLFQSLAAARKAGDEVMRDTGDGDHVTLTEDKRLERKETVSKEAFLAALRRGTRS